MEQLELALVLENGIEEPKEKKPEERCRNAAECEDCGYCAYEVVARAGSW